MSNNDVCIMLKIPTIFLEMIICWTTDSSTFSVLPFFTYQLSVSCHLLKRHSNQCEIYREVTVYTSCTCVLNQSLYFNNLGNKPWEPWAWFWSESWCGIFHRKQVNRCKSWAEHWSIGKGGSGKQNRGGCQSARWP